MDFGNSRWPRARRALCLLLTAAAIVAPTVVLKAQDAAPVEAEPYGPPAPARTQRTPEPTRVYVAMWTTHLKNKFVRLDNNWVAGLSHRGWFGATFLNSYDRRAFTGGIQRTIAATAPRPVRLALGYRLGFVTGYDERFVELAKKTPVLPLVQPFLLLDVLHVGIEVQYTFIVVSTAVSYRF